MATHEDVSTHKEYVNLINKIYRSREVMLVHGVTFDPNYKKVIDVYSITPKPGIGGPEILSQDELPIGSAIRVLKVERCTNCLLGGSDHLVVELPGLEKYANHSITIGVTFGGRDILVYERDTAAINSSLFEKVKD
jgi:hypothetical protein